ECITPHVAEPVRVRLPSDSRAVKHDQKYSFSHCGLLSIRFSIDFSVLFFPAVRPVPRPRIRRSARFLPFPAGSRYLHEPDALLSLPAQIFLSCAAGTFTQGGPQPGEIRFLI